VISDKYCQRLYFIYLFILLTRIKFNGVLQIHFYLVTSISLTAFRLIAYSTQESVYL